MAAERTATPTGRGDDRSIGAALQRYRAMALVVGVLLVALFFVAVPLEYIWHVPEPATVLGTAHGFLYGLFFLATVDLALRARWTFKGTVLTLVAGTVPVLSFYAERKATAKTRAGERV